MNRSELLDKLAMELAEWPDFYNDESPPPNCPGIWGTHQGVWECFAKGNTNPILHDHWLQRRAELINFPPDSEAPEWAKWKAQDSDGLWYWFSEKPIPLASGLMSDASIEWAKAGKIPAGHDWRTTLMEVKRVEQYTHMMDNQLAADITAHGILNAAAQHMQDRAATYDKPEGERSMNATVQAFNIITDNILTEEQGWLFMQLLKAVRSQQGDYRADSYEDGAAYVALAGEAAAKERAGD